MTQQVPGESGLQGLLNPPTSCAHEPLGQVPPDGPPHVLALLNVHSPVVKDSMPLA
jgi:hypothetical protein